MAKIIGPLFSVDARGKVGALVYGRAGGFQTVRSKVAPKTQNTGPQNAIQDCLHTVVKLWQDSGVLNYEEWLTWSREHTFSDWSGVDKMLSPYSWFCKCNFWPTWFAWGDILVPPPRIYTGGIVVESPDVQSGFVEITTVSTFEGLSGNWSALVWCYLTDSPARHPTIKDAQYIDHLESLDDVYDIYYDTSLYGHFWVMLCDHRTGLKNMPYYFKTDPY